METQAPSIVVLERRLFGRTIDGTEVVLALGDRSAAGAEAGFALVGRVRAFLVTLFGPPPRRASSRFASAGSGRRQGRMTSRSA